MSAATPEFTHYLQMVLSQAAEGLSPGDDDGCPACSRTEELQATAACTEECREHAAAKDREKHLNDASRSLDWAADDADAVGRFIGAFADLAFLTRESRSDIRKAASRARISPSSPFTRKTSA